jgi:hypothetical protein
MIYPHPSQRGPGAFSSADFTTVFGWNLSIFHLQETPESHFPAYLAQFSRMADQD